MFGSSEMIIVLVIVLVLFGGSQLPKLAKNLGKAQKEFKDGIADADKPATTGGDCDPAGRPARTSAAGSAGTPHAAGDLIARRPQARATRVTDSVAATLQDPAAFALAAPTPHAVLDALFEGVLEAS